jgi:ATP-binding cassette subfamily B protein
VERAARQVHAHEFIQALGDGYTTPVAERGAGLSVGQKQLLAFARALAHDPQLLVLDEATSSVDTETELLIQDALDQLMKDRTCLIIAHRLSTIQNCDRIIVLHKGEIREEGSHFDLLKNRGIYYKLYQLQYKNQVGQLSQQTADRRQLTADKKTP